MLSPNAFEEDGGRLVVRVLVHELPIEGPLENGLAEAVTSPIRMFQLGTNM
jgi:hypothetical protein